MDMGRRKEYGWVVGCWVSSTRRRTGYGGWLPPQGNRIAWSRTVGTLAIAGDHKLKHPSYFVNNIWGSLIRKWCFNLTSRLKWQWGLAQSEISSCLWSVSMGRHRVILHFFMLEFHPFSMKLAPCKGKRLAVKWLSKKTTEIRLSVAFGQFQPVPQWWEGNFQLPGVR